MNYPAPLAKTYGLQVSTENNRTSLSRGPVTVVFAERFRDDSPCARHRAFCALYGARLGIDRLTCDYQFEDERPSGEGARNVYEMASIYGERFQQLVPSAALDVASRVANFAVFRREWLSGCTSELALVREIGRHFHVLGEHDFDHLPYSRENVIEYARYALFYDAYKFRPHRVDESDLGRIRWYRTANGQAASRATLLPDFDYDAAQAGGGAVIVDRNEFAIVQPAGDPGSALSWLRTAARDRVSSALQPFSRRIYRLSTDGVTVGQTYGGPELNADGLGDSVVDVVDESHN